MEIFLIILKMLLEIVFIIIFVIGSIGIGYSIFSKMEIMKDNGDYFIFGSITGIGIGFIILLVKNLLIK